MITREQYMADSSNLHHTYYTEVAKDLGIHFAPDSSLIRECQRALANGDVHLNSIALHRWDAMTVLLPSRAARLKLKERGEGWSLSTGVCALKAAAMNAVAELNKKEG